MKNNNLIARTLVLLSVLAMTQGAGQAAVIFDSGNVTFAPTGTQSGRISRDGVPSDWSGPKVFPGVLNPATRYSYELFTLNVGPYSFIQINFDDPSAAFFVSAYLGSFNPASLAGNYLGDPGLSQPFGNPSFFQIVVAPFTTLALPVNETASGGGTGRTIALLVEGFVDTEFNDVPESSSILLLGSGFGLIALLRKP